MTAEQQPEGRPRQVPQWLIEQLRERFKPFPAPKERTFAPAEKSVEELLEIGLPPKPDAAKQPRMRELWEKAFGKEVTVVPFVFDVAALSTFPYELLDRQVDEMAVQKTRFETSSNWSGAYITANWDRQFMQVSGVWTVPELLDLPPGEYQGPTGLPYVCSNWIGLDGQRRYLDSSLPQMGTATTLNLPGPPTTLTWTQWWARGTGTTIPLPMGLAVNPGDQVLSILTAINPQTVVFLMTNLTTLHFMPVLGTAPPVTLPDGSTVIPSIAGATAEWIVERPRIVGSSDQCNFPNYHATDFSYCNAVEANEVNIASLLGGVEQELRGERLIRMFDVLSNPQRTAFISMPSKTSDTSVHVDWGGF